MSYSISVKKVQIGDKVLYPDSELVLKERGITIIVGNNGCGKTTLLNQILYTNSDSVLLIAQENDLIFDNKSTEDNIILFDGDSNRLKELLKTLDMEYLLTRNPSQLSGGERRIISLLRLFFVDKEIIILDEPTNDLDYRCVEIIKKIITDVSKEKALLIVTHDERILEIADIRYSFSDGTIKSENPTNEPNNLIPPKESKVSFSKALKKDVIGLVLFLLVIISIIGSELSFFLFKPEQLETITEGQTNLATKQYGNINTMLNEGYLPLNIYLAYDGSITMDFLKLYADEMNKISMSNGTSNMFISNSLGKKVYLGVFWDPETGEKTYPLRDYQTMFLITQDKKIDFSDTFSVSDGVTEIADTYTDGVSAEIDDDIYRSMEEAYYTVYPNLQPRLYIIFNEDIEQLKNENENWFVKNNVTISICNQINTLTGLKKFLYTTVLCIISSVGISILYFCISTNLSRKQIIVFRNFGIHENNAFNEFYNSKCAPKEKAALAFAFMMINAVLLFFEPDKLIFGTMIIIALGTYLALMMISRKILKKSIQSIYSFRGLYDN